MVRFRDCSARTPNLFILILKGERGLCAHLQEDVVDVFLL